MSPPPDEDQQHPDTAGDLATDLTAIEEHLLAVQRARGLSDAAMAQALHVPRASWVLVRQGTRPLDLGMIYWAARAFGEEVLPTLHHHLLGMPHRGGPAHHRDVPPATPPLAPPALGATETQP